MQQPNQQQSEPTRRLITKARPIASFLGITERQVYHCNALGSIPGLTKRPGLGLTLDVAAHERGDR
jgi:hypothetical protein